MIQWDSPEHKVPINGSFSPTRLQYIFSAMPGKRKTLKKWRKNAVPAGAAKATGRAVAVIDEGPIRAAAVKECRKAMRDLEKARKKLEDFERVDQPAFARWYNTAFGAELSRIREWKEKIEGMERLIEEIESVRFEQGISYHAAYECVMDRRNHPERYEREREEPRRDGPAEDRDEDGEGNQDPFGEPETDAHGDADEEDLLFAAFLEFAAQGPGMADILGDPHLISILFAKFKKEFGKKERKGKRTEEPRKAGTPPRQDRVKRLYRALVKRLHPDFRRREDAHDDELWHRVQAAYAQGDAEGLETLTALCDIRIDNAFATGSVSSILAVGADQKEQLAALKKRMRQAKKDPAWGFGRKPGLDQSLGPLIRREMESALDSARMHFEFCEDTVKKWSVARPRKNARRPVSGRQAEFGF